MSGGKGIPGQLLPENASSHSALAAGVSPRELRQNLARRRHLDRGWKLVLRVGSFGDLLQFFRRSFERDCQAELVGVLSCGVSKP